MVDGGARSSFCRSAVLRFDWVEGISGASKKAWLSTVSDRCGGGIFRSFARGAFVAALCEASVWTSSADAIGEETAASIWFYVMGLEECEILSQQLGYNATGSHLVPDKSATIE
jgi:hypothetical protein